MTLIVFVTPDCKPVIFKSTVCSLSTNFETKVADLPVIVTGEPFGFPNAGGFVGLTLGIIGILLLTTPGERVFQPTFGSRLKSIVFEQGQDIPNRIEEAIRGAADNFLPYINIINVFTIQEQNQVNVQVEFSVPLNPEDIEVLNFDFRIGE